MKAVVINRFVDAETGGIHLPGSEVDMDRERVDRLVAARCVQRMAQSARPAQDDSKPETKRRGRPRTKRAE